MDKFFGILILGFVIVFILGIFGTGVPENKEKQ